MASSSSRALRRAIASPDAAFWDNSAKRSTSLGKTFPIPVIAPRAPQLTKPWYTAVSTPIIKVTSGSLEVIYSDAYRKSPNPPNSLKPTKFGCSDLKEKKGFHVLDTETRTLEFIENPNKLFHFLYYDDEKTDYDEIINKMDFDDFKNILMEYMVSHSFSPDDIKKVRKCGKEVSIATDAKIARMIMTR